MLVINCYSPPGHDPTVPTVLEEVWTQFSLPGKPWLVVGDFNKKTDESAAGRFLQIHGGHLVGDPEIGSRWNSPHFIDWGMVSALDEASFIKMHDHIHISDHKGFWVSITRAARAHQTGRLKPSPKWYQPTWISKPDWISFLETCWNEPVLPSSRYGSLLDALNRPFQEDSEEDVQLEWDHFMACLNLCFFQAFTKIGRDPQNTEEQNREIQKVLRQPGLSAKGAPATWQQINGAAVARGDPRPGEKVRRLRRKLARVFEARRCCLKNILPPNKIDSSPDPERDFSDHIKQLDDLILQLQSTLTKIEADQDQKHDDIARWKARLNDSTLKGIAVPSMPSYVRYRYRDQITAKLTARLCGQQSPSKLC